ncbi:MAG: protein-tyrosine-phosphatase [bacterium]|nr:protein-tyrosine-phosphatase [bacterium]
MILLSRKKESDIPSGVVDIHCHILPGVDDGSRSVSQSCRMLDIAWENGIRAIVATPHYMPEGRHPAPETLRRLTEELRKYASLQQYNLEIYEGNEIYYHQEVPELLEEGKILPLAGSRYVLVEFSPADDARYIRNALSELQAAGYEPILAHVERYMSLCGKNGDRIGELREMGVLIQVNANSIEGKMGPVAKKTVHNLLKKQWVDFVATDAHSDRSRSHAIEDCVKMLRRKYPAEYVEDILGGNARRILSGDRKDSYGTEIQ